MVRKFAYFAYLESGVTPHLGLQVKKILKGPHNQLYSKGTHELCPQNVSFLRPPGEDTLEKGQFFHKF
jgi:hypothetical protein